MFAYKLEHVAGGPLHWPRLVRRNGAPPVIAVPCFLLQGPAAPTLYLVPRSGSRFLWGNVQGPAIMSQFHAGNAYFRRDIDS